MNYPKIYVLLLLLLLSGCLWLAGTRTKAATDSPDKDQLRHLKTVLWPQAYREQDVKLLDRILHPTFQKIAASGQITHKQDELEYISKHKPSYQSFRFEIERLEIYEGKFAVVSGTGFIEEVGTQGKTERRYRSSNHLIKLEGRWQAVSSHISGVQTIPLNK